MSSSTERRVVIIVQARMASTRLPGKVLADLAGRPLLWHVLSRARKSTLVDEATVATSTDPSDDVIERFCREHAIACFRGSHADVLDRYYQAAREARADVIVRLTGDCPLSDPTLIDEIVGTFLHDSYDYVTNCLLPTYPEGLDIEVFSFAALERAWQEARQPAEREHVTPYLRAPSRFRVLNVEYRGTQALGHLRWSVDEAQDLAFVRKVYDRFGVEGPARMEQVVEFVRQDAELEQMVTSRIRNDGYYRSLASEPPVSAHQRSLARSQELGERARRVIPSMSQTFSKGPSQYVQGVAPMFLQRGLGSHVWDVDGNEYVDYPMGLGPIILGHSHPAVNEAVRRQMEEGTILSLAHPLEVEVSELLVDLIPCAEMVRFAKNGSDATAGAVRAARAYTGRDVIAFCGYHGWQDWYIGSTTRNKGVPRAVQELSVGFQYNDIASLERVFAAHPGQVAGVVMEPVGVVQPTEGFLTAVKDLAHREGAVLIFDEIITGFRLAMGGAQEYFGVVPDLACVGKAVANGYPLSAVVGRREIMELFDEIFFSFTFGGEAVSLAAAKATIREMQRTDAITHLWSMGERLQDGFAVLARHYGLEQLIKCIGLPPRTVVTFQDPSGAESLTMKSLFQQECLKRGILFLGSQMICLGHTESDIDYTLRVFRTAMEILADALREGSVEAKLEGTCVQPVFRRA